MEINFTLGKNGGYISSSLGGESTILPAFGQHAPFNVI